MGIIIIQGSNKPEKKQVIKRPNLNNYIKRWVKYNWLGIRTGKSEMILPKPVFDKFVKDRGEIFSNEKYNIILRTAVKAGVISENKIIEKNEDEAIKKLLTKYNKHI